VTLISYFCVQDELGRGDIRCALEEVSRLDIGRALHDTWSVGDHAAMS